VIKAFTGNKLEFRIDDSFDLVPFIRKLEYLGGGLPKEISSANKIIKFEDEKDENVYKWNKDTFIDYLTLESKMYDPSTRQGISPEEYNKYIKLVE